MSKDRFIIENVLNDCDCCGFENDAHSNTYSVTTSPEYSEFRTGLNLCSYCLLMLKYKLNDFLKEE